MENTLPQPIDSNRAHALAAQMLVTQNKNAYEVKQSLIAEGLDEASAENVVYNIEAQIENVKSSKAKKDMLWGGLWMFGGIIVTAVTMSAASGGGRYVVAWGAIVFGGIQFFRGIMNSIK